MIDIAVFALAMQCNRPALERTAPLRTFFVIDRRLVVDDVTRHALEVLKAIEQGDQDLIVMNYANADMVGHSGKMAPTVQAVEAVDAGLGEIYAALRRCGGSWIITADHGNAETMIDPVTKGPHTYHTTNPVPFILVDETQRILRQGGALQDISPTLLGFLGEKQPKEMSGRDLRL